MKRVITLLMAAVMVIGTAGLASAVEFKASGHMHIMMGVQDNGNGAMYDKDVAEDNFYAAQRFRPKLTMSAEGVTAVFEAQQHQKYWGDGFTTGNNSRADVRVRNAYIDFKLPSTPVSLKIGYQALSLPSIWGHPIMDDQVSAAIATIPFSDQVALAVFYARPDNNAVARDADGRVQYTSNSADRETYDLASEHNSTDMFGLLLPLDFGTVQATPYFVYAKVGAGTFDTPSNATYSWNDTLIVGGANVAIAATDALSVKFDAIVTNHKSDGKVNGEDWGNEMKTGWMVATAVDYEMAWGTPGFFAWYASGDDDEGEGGLANPVATAGMGVTTWGFEGYNTFDLGAQIGTSGRSTWGAGLQVADMSFIDSLKHTVRVAYIQGTSDKEEKNAAGVKSARAGDYEAWTTKDSFIEFNVDSTWSIYENLAAVVELGGFIPSLGSATKGKDVANAQPGDFYDEDFAWRAQVTFRFSF